jgi:hypothetical protein
MAIYQFFMNPTAAERNWGVILYRLTDFLQRRGYVLGPRSVEVHRDGTVLIDADRSPSADWPAFNPMTETPDETTDRTQRDQAKAAYDALKAGTATNAQVQKTIAFLLRERFRELAP